MSGRDSLRVRYEALVQAHAVDLHRFAYRLTGKMDAAQDLVQETFLEAWRSIGSQSMPGKERAWLFSVLRHRWAHQRRDSSRRIQTRDDSEQLHQQPSSDAGVLDRMIHTERLQSALDALDAPFRETFLMVFMQGLTCKEAAEALGVPLGTVLSRVSRAKEAMRKSVRKGKQHSGSPSPETMGK
jgi:RNA polymerase sigma-70 factor (ECF subfamily)